VLRILKTGNVACELEDDVLESAARSETRIRPAAHCES
jgi:hypothetical protein